jgi:hypothetical protein
MEPQLLHHDLGHDQAGYHPANPLASGNFPVFDGWGARFDDLEPARMPVAAF